MTHDSPVAVKAPYSAKKRKTTIRISGDLWDNFKRNTAEKHLSTCHVLEALMTAWLYSGSMVPGVDGHVNLTLKMQHVVERPRRREDEKYVRKTKKKTNHYDRTGYWYFDSELEPGEIVVEQPREWPGEEKGFTWVESRRLWWKKEQPSSSGR